MRVEKIKTFISSLTFTQSLYCLFGSIMLGGIGNIILLRQPAWMAWVIVSSFISMAILTVTFIKGIIVVRKPTPSSAASRNPLIACKDCDKQFSPDAKCCPNCGAKKPKKPSNFWKYAICIFFGMAFLQATFSPKDPKVIAQHKADSEADDAKLHVVAACQIAIESSLHDPGSAEFDRLQSPITDLGNGQFDMKMHLRARNGFNALRAMVINCRVTRTGDEWKVTNIRTL